MIWGILMRLNNAQTFPRKSIAVLDRNNPSGEASPLSGEAQRLWTFRPGPEPPSPGRPGASPPVRALKREGATSKSVKLNS